MLWLVIDRHHSDFDEKERNMTSLKGAYWGLGIADHFSEKLLLGKRYYAYGQFTRFIRPGDRIIASSSPNTLAAYNRESGKIVIVAVNASESVRDMTFDLSAFKRIPASSAKVIRTSGAVNEGENWNEDIPAVAVLDKKLAVSLAPFSITTFVIDKEQ